MYLAVSSQLVFAGSADTQIFVMSDEVPNQLLSFSGFLGSTSDDIENFRISDAILYTGSNVGNIFTTTNKRIADNKTSEHHSFRRFEINTSLMRKMFNWLFEIELEVL